MPWNLLILPLVGGYFIISRANYIKYTKQHLSEQRLIFDSILVSVNLLITTVFIRIAVEYFFPNFIHFFYSLLPNKTPYIGTSFMSFLFAILYTIIRNKIFDKDKNKQVLKAIKNVGTELETLLRVSFKDSQLLQFTLDTNKVYIGLVKELPKPNVDNYIRIVPFSSGYRDEKGRLKIISTYHNIPDLRQYNIDLIITLDNVVTVSRFNIDLFDYLNSRELISPGVDSKIKRETIIRNKAN